MNRKVVLHIVTLLTATLLTYFWVTDETLVDYSLQLTGILLLTLILSHRLLKTSSFKLVESVVTTVSVLLVTSSSGGLSSPLFFLNLLLLFELSLLLEPIIPVVLSLGFIFFYFYSHQLGNSPFLLVTLFSFPLMTPLAYFFGKIYLKEEHQKVEIKHLENKIEELKEEIIEEEISNDSKK